MSVSGCRDQTVLAEQVKFYNVCTVESGIHPVFIYFLKAVLLMLLGIFPIHGEQVDSLIGSIVKPGEMVDTQYIDLNVLSLHVGKSGGLLQDSL